MTKKVKKAQIGYKSRSVERSPDGMYKMVTKTKSGPGVEKKVVREKRTLKGLLKGAPRSSGALKSEQQDVMSPISDRFTFVSPNENLLKSAEYKSKYGSKTSLLTNKKQIKMAKVKKAQTGKGPISDTTKGKDTTMSSAMKAYYNDLIKKKAKEFEQDRQLKSGKIPSGKKGKKVVAKKAMYGTKAKAGSKVSKKK
jgi:hypothetical protein